MGLLRVGRTLEGRLSGGSGELSWRRLGGGGEDTICSASECRLEHGGQVVHVKEQGGRIKLTIQIQIAERALLASQRQTHSPETIRPRDVDASEVTVLPRPMNSSGIDRRVTHRAVFFSQGNRSLIHFQLPI